MKPIKRAEIKKIIESGWEERERVRREKAEIRKIKRALYLEELANGKRAVSGDRFKVQKHPFGTDATRLRLPGGLEEF